MATRRYVSSVRTAAAAAKRDRVIGAAARLLLEAIFDQIAERGGLVQIPEAMAMLDSRAALDRLVEIFCAFWSSDPAVGRLHEAMATDPEFAQALIERNERRRKTADVLVGRIAGKAASARARQAAVDMIFALTSFSMFAMLSQHRSLDDVCVLVKSACRSALDPLLPDTRSAAKRR